MAVNAGQADAATPAHTPAVSMMINPRTIGAVPTYSDYVDAAMKLVQIDKTVPPGAAGDFESGSWSDLEPSQGTYNLTSLTSTLDTTPQQQVLLNIKVIDTTNRTTPAFLNDSSFDSPIVSTEFHNLIDGLAPHFGTRVKYIGVGNEVDAYLSQHPEQWAAYTTFYKDAVSYIHKVAPNVQVGVTGTYGGFVGSSAAQLATLNSASDVVIATYYPLDGTFVPRSPSVVSTELGWLVSVAAGKPLVLQEVGYPSASALGSSETIQAQFVANMFKFWRSTGATRMPFINFVGLHDSAPATCAQLGQYYAVAAFGGSVSNFESYLCSLGMRHSDGTPKAAWNTFIGQAAQLPS